MKICILNWKDIKHPQSGGAEILTHELAKRLVQNGDEVIMFVAHFSGGKHKEIIDGITIIREGHPDLRALSKSVHYKAYKYYKNNLQGKIDIIIDEVHGMPFFARFYAKEKVVALICEVADDIWFRMFSFPWNTIGWLLEQFYLLLYRGIPVLTISQSTKKELIKCGMPSRSITVLPMGINRVKITNVKKEVNPTLIFVGRLSKMKGIEDAIKATAKAKKSIKKLSLWIVGRGEKSYMEYLKELAKKEGLTDSIIFWDHISEKKKFELMARAQAIVVPSVREGFGLIVPEAGSVGTPAVAYNVYGLCDTVRNNVNGILVEKTYDALAKGITKLLSDKNKYKNMSKAAVKESEKYTWDNTARVAINLLHK